MGPSVNFLGHSTLLFETVFERDVSVNCLQLADGWHPLDPAYGFPFDKANMALPCWQGEGHILSVVGGTCRFAVQSFHHRVLV